MSSSASLFNHIRAPEVNKYLEADMVQTIEEFKKEFMTLAEAAQVLQVKPETFYDHRWRKNRGINIVSFGNGRKKFIRRQDIFSKLRVN